MGDQRLAERQARITRRKAFVQENFQAVFTQLIAEILDNDPVKKGATGQVIAIAGNEDADTIQTTYTLGLSVIH